MFYCPECRQVYEISKSGIRTRLDYYVDFPTIGKPRKICPRCIVNLGIGAKNEKTNLSKM